MGVREASTGFMHAAKRYLSCIDGIESGARVSLRELHQLICTLQIAALELEAVDDDELDDAADELKGRSFERAQRLRKVIAERLPIGVYALVFNPLEEEDRKCILTTLDDDLADIYGDLADGIALAEAGYHGDAVWHWRFLYFNHWGRHAVHAQGAIWQYLADNQGDE